MTFIQALLIATMSNSDDVEIENGDYTKSGISNTDETIDTEAGQERNEPASGPKTAEAAGSRYIYRIDRNMADTGRVSLT